jgi:hypothetical protein
MALHRIMNMAVCNGPSIGGSFRICPDARTRRRPARRVHHRRAADASQRSHGAAGNQRHARRSARCHDAARRSITLRSGDGRTLPFQLDGELREARDAGGVAILLAARQLQRDPRLNELREMRRLFLILLLLLSAAPASAQDPVLPPDTMPVADTIPQELPSPRAAFARAMVIPGWGHVYVGEYRRGAVYFALQSTSWFMLVKTLRGSMRYRTATGDSRGSPPTRSRSPWPPTPRSPASSRIRSPTKLRC